MDNFRPFLVKISIEIWLYSFTADNIFIRSHCRYAAELSARWHGNTEEARMGVPVSMMEPLPRPTAQCEALVEVRLGPTLQLIPGVKCHRCHISSPKTIYCTVYLCPCWFSYTMFSAQESLLNIYILVTLFLRFCS